MKLSRCCQWPVSNNWAENRYICIKCVRVCETDEYVKLSEPRVMKQIEEVVEAVFNHGKLTPNESGNLPKGQMTIAEAINTIYALMTKGEEKL